jgi:ribonuclease VapC
MFIDTSAFIAILSAEPEAARMLKSIRVAARCMTSGLVRLETCVVLAAQKGRRPSAVQPIFDALCAEAEIAVVPITDDMSRIAVGAYDRFGKGSGHQAQLNLADCMSYAVAKNHDVPILFKGNDFSRSDLRVAEY